jgi:hypothetical protein
MGGWIAITTNNKNHGVSSSLHSPFPVSLSPSLSHIFFLNNVMTKDKHGGNKGTIGKYTDTLEGKIGAVVGVFVDFPFRILQMVDFFFKKN